MKIKNTTAGFHLIEIVITLAMITIMSHWILSNYQFMIANERRREAEHQLFLLASAMEEYAIINGSYSGATLSRLHFPAKIAKNYYELAIRVSDKNHYLLAARPLKAIEKRCATLLLSSTGKKSVTGIGSESECW